MHSTETAKMPSIYKAALVFAATAAMLALSGRAPAQTPSPAPRAYAGEPSVRIRGADARGLNLVAFTDWLAAHENVSDTGSAALFVQADANHDGRVTAVELKDFLMGQATKA